MPLLQPRLETDKLASITKLGLSPSFLKDLKPVTLSDLEIAKKLDIGVFTAVTSVTLSPNKPMSGKNFLTMHAPIMVMANPLASNNIALFSSAFPSVNNPSVDVEFAAIKAGKKHLVEFNITLNEPSKTYKFRLFQYPTGTHQDISISGSQIISIVVPAIADYAFTYGAAINQLNTKAEACGWILHSVKISSVD